MSLRTMIARLTARNVKPNPIRTHVTSDRDLQNRQDQAVVSRLLANGVLTSPKTETYRNVLR